MLYFTYFVGYLPKHIKIRCTEEYARWLVNTGRIIGGKYVSPPIVIWI